MRVLPVLLVAVLCVALQSVLVAATYGIDISSPISQGTAACLHNNGYNFAIVRGWMETGAVDNAVYGSVANLLAAGFAHVDVYMFPCVRCGNPRGQVQSAVNAFRSRGVRFGMLWFDIEVSDWGSCDNNFAFVQDLVAEAQAMGVNIGIYTNENNWSQIMCGRSGFQSIPLWYAHWDGSASFSDFRSFGGWSHGAMKQIRGDNTVCGFDIDTDWYP